MKVLNKVVIELLSLPKAPPERGGIIGGKNGVITEFFLDETVGSTSEATYEPNTDILNDVIANWFDNDIEFYGMVHSHPKNERELSNGDIEYIEEIMSNSLIGAKKYFPIVLPGVIIPFVAVREEDGLKIQKETLDICWR